MARTLGFTFAMCFAAYVLSVWQSYNVYTAVIAAAFANYPSMFTCKPLSIFSRLHKSRLTLTAIGNFVFQLHTCYRR
jgi:hypothetical protein